MGFGSFIGSGLGGVAGAAGGIAGGVLGGLGNGLGANGGQGIPGYDGSNFFNGPSDHHVTDLQNKLNGMKMPGDIAAPTALTSYVAKDYSAPLPEYDTLRNQTSQQLNAQSQGQSDAMQRRFAAMGNLNSGAYVKAAELGDQQANENKANSMNQIGFQEAQARRSLQQNEENKAFQSGEATKQFNANQALKVKQMNNAQMMENNQFNFDANSKIAGLDLSYKSAQQQSADDAFNAAMGQYQARHSGGLLGSGGFLGTGIGV